MCYSLSSNVKALLTLAREATEAESESELVESVSDIGILGKRKSEFSQQESNL